MNIIFDDAKNHNLVRYTKTPGCKRYSDTGTHEYVALMNDEIVGDFNIRTIKSSVDCIGHIGYAVRKEFRGRGIGTKLCEEAIRLARDNFKINDIIICCASDNINSRRIIEKCGGIFFDERVCHTGKHNLLRFIIRS